MNGFDDIPKVSLKLPDHVRVTYSVLNIGVPDDLDEKLSNFLFLVNLMKKIKEEMAFKI